MVNQLSERQAWVAPKLTVFGDVNALTMNKAVGPGDGFFLNPPNPPVAIHSV